MQQLMRHKGKKFTWTNAAEESFQRIKKELCEAPVLGMPTEKGMYGARHGCVSSRYFWDSPSRTRMEWEDSLETNSIREQGPK